SKKDTAKLLKQGPKFPSARPGHNFTMYDTYDHESDLGDIPHIDRAILDGTSPSLAPPSRPVPHWYDLSAGFRCDRKYDWRSKIQGTKSPSPWVREPERHQKGKLHYGIGGQRQDGIRGPSPDGAFSKEQLLWGHPRLQTF